MTTMRETVDFVKATSPSSFGGSQALGLAWSIPVLLAVYVGLGFWLGGLLGSRLGGVLVGWGLGMAAIFYEIRKSARRENDASKQAPR